MIETLPLHHIARVVSLLTQGKIVAFPTGTSYGLGVNALDTEALQRLNALKQRPADKAYTVLLPDREPERFVAWSDTEKRAFASLRDRPLTILVTPTQATEHLARDGRLGVRTPDHPFTHELVSLTTFPVTATSANFSGGEPACTLREIEETLASRVSLTVVDGGSLARRLPSTVAAYDGARWQIVRKGEVTIEEFVTATPPG